MIQLLRWLWVIGLFVGASVGVTAFLNWQSGQHRPRWTGVALGLEHVHFK